MAKHNDTGKWGEDLAREYLTAKGYAVMERNIHVGHNELDIVAMKGDRIIFVEVKTRTTDIVDPLEAITDKKIRRIVRAADSFLRSHPMPHEAQFDVIIILGSPETGHTLQHYPDAFRPPLCGAW